MDFHSLSRRELQALCKRNKIPANMTNAAMADALKALEIVEGIEEFMQPSQTESAQSSIEGLEGSEVSSPFVPTTAARSTRRRNALKNDVEAVTSIMTTARRTTRKTAAKGSNESQVDSMETPAVAAQASRRKVQMASACLKMDSQLNECAEEEKKKKKDALTTPALASRRRVEETEKKVYSTRRSVRLAVKNVQMVNDVKSEESQISKNELFPKDGEDQEMNLKESMDECDEMSEVTGADAVENMEESSEIVSEQKEDTTIGEVEMGTIPEEVAGTDFPVEVEQKEEMCDNTESPADEVMAMPVNVNNEVQISEDCVDVCTSEIEVTVENSKEVSAEIDAGSQDEASDFVEFAHLEAKVDEEVSDETVEVEVEDNKEMDVEELNVTLDKLTELRLQPEELKQTLLVEGSDKTSEKESKNSPSKLQSEAPQQVTGEQIPISDNKENNMMVSEGMKPANMVDLNELSMNKLTKMLREKLQIANKSSNEATARPALQQLP